MNLIRGLRHSPKDGHEYESVEDQKDLRIPVQNEDAFRHGITYKAKYIGTQEITRPSSRVEIVSAMRRIRYEYKYRNIKKRKVNMEISIEGIKVTIFKKKKAIEGGKYDSSQLFVMCYPINRVFYVSHDSQDLLIFSYIARGEDGIFRCSVFKSFKKSQAMNIVRTIGQAFEVCHKLNADKPNDENEQESKDETAEDSQGPVDEGKGETDIDEVGDSDIDKLTMASGKEADFQDNATLVTDIDVAVGGTGVQTVKASEILNGNLQLDGNISQLHQFYVQHLHLQKNEVEAARAEVHMLKQQLTIETETRKHAQNRIDRLLAQNRELLVTIQKLMHQVQSGPSSKDIFDPIDESWMTSSSPVADSYFSRVTHHSKPIANKVTNDCISHVFDNVHHQSMNFEDFLIASKNKGDKLDSAVPTMDSKPLQDSREGLDHDEELLSESVGERKGGLSRSFTDLSKIGLEEKKIDLNQNSDRITKFAKTEETGHDKMGDSNDGTVKKSILSKEMMETFSDELNELKGAKEFKTTSVTAL